MLETKKVNFREVLDFIKRRWFIALLISILMFVGLFGLIQLKNRMQSNNQHRYFSEGQMLVTIPRSKDEIVLNQPNTMQIVAPYAEVLKSDLILTKVKSSMTSKMSLKKIRDSVSIRVDNGSTLITVEARGHNAKKVKQILSAYLKVASENINSIMGSGKITILKSDKTPKLLQNSNSLSLKLMVLLILASLFVGTIGAILAELFDKKIRNPFFIESTLGQAPFMIDRNNSNRDVLQLDATMQTKYDNASSILFNLTDESGESKMLVDEFVACLTDSPAYLSVEKLSQLSTGLSQAQRTNDKTIDLLKVKSAIANLRLNNNKIILTSNNRKADAMDTITSSLVDLNCVVIMRNKSKKQDAYTMIKDLTENKKKFIIIYLQNPIVK